MTVTVAAVLLGAALTCAASVFFGLTAGAWMAANLWKKAKGTTWRRLLPSEIKL